MTATHTPGLAVVGEGWLVSTNPATGAEVARVRIAGPGEVAATVARARAAAGWWAGLGVGGRRTRLLGFGSVLANQLPELAELVHREGGKPRIDGVMETTAASPTSAGRPATPPGPGRRRPARQRSPQSSRPGWRTSPWAWSAPWDPGTTRRPRSVCWRPRCWPPERHGRQAQRVHPGGASGWPTGSPRSFPSTRCSRSCTGWVTPGRAGPRGRGQAGRHRLHRHRQEGHGHLC
jgi:hypothetical protein